MRQVLERLSIPAQLRVISDDMAVSESKKNSGKGCYFPRICRNTEFSVQSRARMQRVRISLT